MIYFLKIVDIITNVSHPPPLLPPSRPQPSLRYGPNHIVVCVKIIYLLLDFRKLKLTNQKSMLFLKKRRHPASTCPPPSTVMGCGYLRNSKSCFKGRTQ